MKLKENQAYTACIEELEILILGSLKAFLKYEDEIFTEARGDQVTIREYGGRLFNHSFELYKKHPVFTLKIVLDMEIDDYILFSVGNYSAGKKIAQMITNDITPPLVIIYSF